MQWDKRNMNVPNVVSNGKSTNIYCNLTIFPKNSTHINQHALDRFNDICYWIYCIVRQKR